jgi:hypothetical protein
MFQNAFPTTRLIIALSCAEPDLDDVKRQMSAYRIWWTMRNPESAKVPDNK